jgi:hypothetical protein
VVISDDLIVKLQVNKEGGQSPPYKNSPKNHVIIMAEQTGTLPCEKNLCFKLVVAVSKFTLINLPAVCIEFTVFYLFLRHTLFLDHTLFVNIFLVLDFCM